ncbi:MAG: type III pantothenate kinase [Candidatus Aureabacteria bacterium]|nr:type III pantothenate kinase [Candidatus Auribacterota bacterium]
MKKTSQISARRQRRKERFLVIDIGNTTVHFGICDRERILKQFRISSIASRFRKEAARALRESGPWDLPLGGALVSSVVPLLDSSVNSLCRRMGIIPIWLNHKTPTGITLLYKKPQEIGSDRIANVAAARALYSVPAIVVDIGTAITFDCVSERGAYLGGVIAPGPMLSRAALAECTGLLPFAEIETPPQLIGKSTVRAIQAGVIFGTRALISGIIRGLQKEMGGRPEIIFTGGQLELIIHGWDYAKLVDPLLTLQGLRIIYNRVVASSR